MTDFLAGLTVGIPIGIVAGFCLLACGLAFAGGCLGEIFNKSPER